MTYLPSSYTDADRTTCATLSLDEIVTMLQSHDESVAPVEDLLSYYIESTGVLPDFMTGDLTNPALVDLFADDEFIEAAQDWRQSNAGDEELATLLGQLEAFLTAGGFSTGVVDDTTSLIEEWYINHPDSDDDAADGTASGDDYLMTDTMTIALNSGLPIGFVIILYVLGSDTSVTMPDTLEEAKLEYNVVDSDGESVTIMTEKGEVTVGLGETVSFHNTGLGESVQDNQTDIIEGNYSDLQLEIADIAETISNYDWEDAETQGLVELDKTNMERAKSMAEGEISIVKTMQDILDAMLEAASSLIDSNFRVEKDIISRI